jgi:hypothetical protein
MSRYQCPECGKVVRSGEQNCPQCGRVLKPPLSAIRWAWLLIWGVPASYNLLLCLLAANRDDGHSIGYFLGKAMFFALLAGLAFVRKVV